MSDFHNVSRLRPAAMPRDPRGIAAGGIAAAGGETAASEPASGPAGLTPMEITVFTSRKVLSKTFRAGPDGSGIVKSPGVPFASGTARRHALAGGTPEAELHALAGLLDSLDAHQAIGLGLENSGVGTVELTTREFAPENGMTPRTLEHFRFAEGPGVVLFDYDGGTGFDDLAAGVYPPWAEVATLTRGSVSSGVRHGKTGKQLEAPGEHVYVVLDDMGRAREVADALERLFWVHGHGRVMVSKNGALLRRSPVDLAVFSPERVIYEGAPVVEAPIEAIARTCAVRPGGVLSAQALIDHADAHAPKAEADRRYGEACGAQAVLEECTRKRAEWLADRIERSVATGTPRKVAETRARAFLESARPGARGTWHYTLDLDEPLTLDDGSTVTPRQIRADPARWEGATMPDPVEGREYGPCKAMVMRGSVVNGGPFIHSFAHGRTIYQFDVPPHEGGRGRDRRKGIFIGAGTYQAVAIACEGLMAEAEADIFYGNGRLVVPRLTDARDAGGRRLETPALAALTSVTMRAAMDSVARFYTKTEVRGEVRWKQPPEEIARLVLERGGKAPWRPVVGVVAAPTMRPDGSILSDLGYDAATRLYAMDLPPMPAVPDRPTRADAEAALVLLRDDLLGEFYFDGDVSRSVALSALLSSLTRAAFGPTPMHAMSAPESGSGKGLLCNLVSYLAQGTACPSVSMPERVEEFDKRLDGEALVNRPVMSLDNINGCLYSDKLCQLITEEMVDVRPLGGSTMVSIRPSSFIMANGNNLTVERDLVRRTLFCRIDTRVEQPYRIEYKGDPRALLHADRGRFIHACLIILRAHVVSGSPPVRPALNGFPTWNDRVRSALVWLCQADPADSIETMRALDTSRSTALALVTAWAEVVGPDTPKTVGDMIAASLPVNSGLPTEAAVKEAAAARERFRQALIDFAGRNGHPDSRLLGVRLGKLKDKVLGGYVVCQATPRDGYLRWELKGLGGPA